MKGYTRKHVFDIYWFCPGLVSAAPGFGFDRKTDWNEQLMIESTGWSVQLFDRMAFTRQASERNTIIHALLWAGSTSACYCPTVFLESVFFCNSMSDM